MTKLKSSQPCSACGKQIPYVEDTRYVKHYHEKYGCWVDQVYEEKCGWCGNILYSKVKKVGEWVPRVGEKFWHIDGFEPIVYPEEEKEIEDDVSNV